MGERVKGKWMTLVKLNPEDIRIDQLYLGPGKGARFAATHLPTGLSVMENIPTSSKESGSTIRKRMVSALKKKVLEKGAK